MSDTHGRNLFLASLSDADLGLLEGSLTYVDLPYRERLSATNRPIEHVYFLFSGIASMVTGMRHSHPIEIGIFGREGFANLAVVMGSDRAPSETFMQIKGDGMRITAGDLLAAADRSRSLQLALQRFAHVFLAQTSSTVLANGRATVLERLARWLLMAQDRTGDHIELTHDLLAIILGVRRAGVTGALTDLARRGLVERERGSIRILDRDRLIELANGFYGDAEAELQRLFGGERRRT